MTAGIIIKSKFILANEAKNFQKYVEYMDRKEAITKQLDSFQSFSNYVNGYMNNETKTTGLFTNSNDSLNEERRKKARKIFETAQQNNSILWQVVVSFEDKWLEKNDILDREKNVLDELKLKYATRNSMHTIFEKEALTGSGYWIGSTHRNTDNIHIHIAIVEPIPTRTRGKFKLSSIEQMKSQMVNTIEEHTISYKDIAHIIRNEIVAPKKEHCTFQDQNMRILFSSIYNMLPEDKRKWKYNMNAIKDIRPKIDQLSDMYIQQFHKETFTELKAKLNEQEQKMKEAYGDTSNNYANNKITDLYERLGNVFLKEMIEHNKTTRLQSLKDYKRPSKYIQQYDVRKLHHILNKQYESFRNMQHYERIQRDMNIEL